MRQKGFHPPPPEKKIAQTSSNWMKNNNYIYMYIYLIYKARNQNHY